MIQANCRSRFTAADFEFMTRALARRANDAVSLVELLTDAEARDSVMDHPALLDAILSGTGTMVISPQFYFYVLARHVLRQDGIEDRRLCDYIGSLLEEFSRTARLSGPGGSAGAGKTIYLSDLLLSLREANPTQAFLLRAHVGNYSLFLTGIFPASVERRSRQGAPDCSYYEEVGRASYRALADDRTAHRWGLQDVFGSLAAQFHQVRLALNQLAERLLNLDENIALPLMG